MRSSLLAGVSSTAARQNQRHALMGLGEAGEEGRAAWRKEGSMRSPFAKMALQPLAATWNEQDFTRATTELATSIGDLRSRHEAFEGKPLSEGFVGQAKGKRKGAGETEEVSEDAGQLQMRLEAYKMARRVEPELPPLVPINEGGPRLLPDESIIKRNVLEVIDNMWMPERDWRQRDLHMEQVLRTRDTLIEESSLRWTEDLTRKRMQGEEAMALQRLGPRQNANQAAGLTAEATKTWLSHTMGAMFVARMRLELKLQKMRQGDRLAFTATNRSELQKLGMRSHIEEFDRIHHAMTSNERVNWLKVFLSFYRAKGAINERRVHAQTIFRCMDKLRFTGRLMVKMKLFTDRIRFLQRWWRECSAGLASIVLSLSRRWEKLERLHLGDAQPVDRFRRLEFIRNEMRTKRYKILPQIRIWEEALRSANGRAGQSDWVASIGISMLPSRPTYIPASHPEGESKGDPCNEGCCGRRGDREILAWIETARENPRGWTKLPFRTSARLLRKAKMMRARSRSKSRTGSKQRVPSKQKPVPRELDSGPYGEVPEAIAKQWGVDAQDLPGLAAASRGREVPLFL